MRKHWHYRDQPLISYICRIIALLMVTTVACRLNENPASINEKNEKEWTFMLYDDEDFSNAPGNFFQFYRAMASVKNINVVVIYDYENSPARYWYIDEDFNKISKMDLGEVNMGHSKTLYDFIMYAKTEYPAKRYILDLYDHGGGWKGACWDYTNNYDWLSPDDMYQAIKSAGGVDMIIFSGTCLMGTVETTYELRDLADVYIGSENRSTYTFWNEPFHSIHDVLTENPYIETDVLGKTIVNIIWNNSFNIPTFQSDLTLSAIGLDKINDLANAIDKLSLLYLDNFELFRSHVSTVFEKIQNYKESALDIYDLAEELLKVETDSLIRSQLENVKICLDKAVLAECHGEEMYDSHGLSIYFPNKDSASFDLLYQEPSFNLDFALSTHWDELLTTYFVTMDGKMEKSVPIAQSSQLITMNKKASSNLIGEAIITSTCLRDQKQ